MTSRSLGLMWPRFITCGHQESGDGVVDDGRGEDRAQDVGLLEEDGFSDVSEPSGS